MRSLNTLNQSKGLVTAHADEHIKYLGLIPKISTSQDLSSFISFSHQILAINSINTTIFLHYTAPKIPCYLNSSEYITIKPKN